MLQLLFAGGLLTKVAVIVLTAGLLTSGASCAFKTVQLKATQHKVAGLEVKVTQLSTDNAILKKNVETITKVNETNVATNNKLLEERRDSEAAIAALAKQRADAKKKLDDANKKIDAMLKDPKNNGAVAPVLRETIRDIQRKTK